MTPIRSLLVAGGLTAVVVGAVAGIGARQGGFGLGGGSTVVNAGPSTGAALQPTDSPTSAASWQERDRNAAAGRDDDHGTGERPGESD